jgi:hypothetical protein
MVAKGKTTATYKVGDDVTYEGHPAKVTAVSKDTGTVDLVVFNGRDNQVQFIRDITL